MQNKIFFERQFKNSIKKIIKEILLENEQQKQQLSKEEKLAKRNEALEKLKASKDEYLKNVKSVSEYINNFITELGMRVSDLKNISDQNKDNEGVYKKYITGARNLETIKHFRDMLDMTRITDQGFENIVNGFSKKINEPDPNNPRAIESSIEDTLSLFINQKTKMEKIPEILQRYNISFKNFDEYFKNIFTALDGAITSLENMSLGEIDRTKIKLKPFYRENKKIRRGRFVK